MAPIEAKIDGNLGLKTENSSNTITGKLSDGIHVRITDHEVGGSLDIISKAPLGQLNINYSVDKKGISTFTAINHKFKIKST